VPTLAEILRIKAVLILRSNATRDYLDFVALADGMGEAKVIQALSRFDEYYPQPNEESALQQLEAQLANPLPFDLEEARLVEYKDLATQYQNWGAVKGKCTDIAVALFDRISEGE
jgi:hypothetical protein